MRQKTEERKQAYDLVKQARKVTEENLTESGLVFQNVHGHEYSYFNSSFLLVQGAVETYDCSNGEPAIIRLGGKNQWKELGFNVLENQKDNPFFIWVPSIKRKKAARFKKNEEDMKQYHYYLCQVWTEAQVEKEPEV